MPIVACWALIIVGQKLLSLFDFSPAGSIARNSPAARFLGDLGLTPKDFNTYGARRGNDAVMARGTFANTRLINKFISKPGSRTIHFPTGDQLDIFDAAMRYAAEGHQLIILAGKDYGSGSSRDWAAKGPYLLVRFDLFTVFLLFSPFISILGQTVFDPPPLIFYA